MKELLENNESVFDSNFQRLCNFIEDFTGYKAENINNNTSINFDIKITGDDADEFMQSFSKEFSVNLSEFNFHNYFDEEGFIGPITSLFLIIKNRGLRKKKPLLFIDLLNSIKCGNFSPLVQGVP